MILIKKKILKIIIIIILNKILNRAFGQTFERFKNDLLAQIEEKAKEISLHNREDIINKVALAKTIFMGQFSTITNQKELETMASDIFFITEDPLKSGEYRQHYEYFVEEILRGKYFPGEFPRTLLTIKSHLKTPNVGLLGEQVLVYILFDSLQNIINQRKPITEHPLFSHLPKEIFGKYTVEMDSVRFEGEKADEKNSLQVAIKITENPNIISSKTIYFGMNQTMRLDVYFELVPIDPKSGLKNIPVGGGSKFYSSKKNFSQQVFEDNFLSADPRLAFINPSGKYSSEIGAKKFREYYDSKLDKEHCIILSFAYANSPDKYLDKDQGFEDGKGGYYIQISRNTWPFKEQEKENKDIAFIKKSLDEEAKFKDSERTRKKGKKIIL